MLGQIIGGIMIIIVGIMLYPTMVEEFDLIANSSIGNETIVAGTWGETMLSLTPLILASVIFFTAIVTIWSALKSIGQFGGDDEDDSEDYDEDEIKFEEDPIQKLPPLKESKPKSVSLPLSKVEVKEKDLVKSKFD